MESIGNLLGRFTPKEPDEISLAKRYIADTFDEPSTVSIKDDCLIITVASASLAGTLRMRMVQLQAACNTSKRIVLRIS